VTIQPGGRLGNYDIVEKIGAGGMGAVYKGYQAALGRYVAIKVLPPQTAGDPAFAERFAQEAKAIGKLRHPNIMTAFDFAHEGDIAYLVSEFIDGGTLADQLGSPLPLDYAIGILTPIAAALDYAHARGIVHRDIKPQNVLMTHDGTPVLTDFGLAKIVGPGSGMTQVGSLMGTAEYIAPECAAGAEVAGPAADQYALGLIAYQMLVGRHPFPADNPLSALMAHVHKPVPLPSSLGVTLPPGTEAALLRSLAKRPEERFARNSDFVKALAGSTFAGIAPLPSTAPPAPGIVGRTSQPPTIPPATTPLPSADPPILSASALVRPIDTRPSTPPAQRDPSVMFPGPARAATAAVAAPPIRIPKAPPWWRRRRTLVLAALIVVLALFIVPRLDARVGGVAGGGPARQTASEPARTQPRASAPVVIPTNTTVATPVASTPVPTPVRTPTPAPSAVVDDYGNTAATAALMNPGTVYNGTIEPAGDVDWFRFGVTSSNTTINVEYKGNTLAGGAIALLQGGTVGQQPAQLVEETDVNGSVHISFLARDPGVYFVRIRSARGDTGTYAVGVGLTTR
jgi:eukaryotic-like serine/threonine-protein kinase